MYARKCKCGVVTISGGTIVVVAVGRCDGGVFAGAGCGVVTISGGTIIVVAVGRCNGCMLATTSGGVENIGGGTIVVVAIRNICNDDILANVCCTSISIYGNVGGG